MLARACDSQVVASCLHDIATVLQLTALYLRRECDMPFAEEVFSASEFGYLVDSAIACSLVESLPALRFGQVSASCLIGSVLSGCSQALHTNPLSSKPSNSTLITKPTASAESHPTRRNLMCETCERKAFVLAFGANLRRQTLQPAPKVYKPFFNRCQLA